METWDGRQDLGFEFGYPTWMMRTMMSSGGEGERLPYRFERRLFLLRMDLRGRAECHGHHDGPSCRMEGELRGACVSVVNNGNWSAQLMRSWIGKV